MGQNVKMNAIIFAGGIGSRMWPLSRKKSPKQFEPIVKNRSTLQMAIDNLRPEFDWENIYISTGQQYKDLIEKQIPQIPPQNIIGEPEMRDVAPAVGYLMAILAKTDPDTPVAILWSDHLVENVKRFKEALIVGGQYLQKHPNKFVFIGQKPRFANQNLGWIEYGKTIEPINDISIKEFVSWHYRPDLETAAKYFQSGKHAWNPGYFVVNPQFVLDQFKKHAPDMYRDLKKLQDSYGTPEHQQNLDAIYPQMEKIHFDNAVLEKVSPNQAVVLSVDLGWSDIGTWEALKEAIQKNPHDNLVHGNTHTHNTKNSVVYSYTDQLVTTIDMGDVVVVVTKDAILVTKQESIPHIKNMLKDFEGTDKEQYT